MAKRGPIAISEPPSYSGQTPNCDSSHRLHPQYLLMTDWDCDGFGRKPPPALPPAFWRTDTANGGSSSYIFGSPADLRAPRLSANHFPRPNSSTQRPRHRPNEPANTTGFLPDCTRFEIYAHGHTKPFGQSPSTPLGNLYSADSHSSPSTCSSRRLLQGLGKQHDGPRLRPAHHRRRPRRPAPSAASPTTPTQMALRIYRATSSKHGNPVRNEAIAKRGLEWHGAPRPRPHPHSRLTRASTTHKGSATGKVKARPRRAHLYQIGELLQPLSMATTKCPLTPPALDHPPRPHRRVVLAVEKRALQRSGSKSELSLRNPKGEPQLNPKGKQQTEGDAAIQRYRPIHRKIPLLSATRCSGPRTETRLIRRDMLLIRGGENAGPSKTWTRQIRSG